MTRCSVRIAAALVVIALGHGASASAQVGKGAIVDTNTAAEKDLLAMPHMTPAIVKGMTREAALHEHRRAERVPHGPDADRRHS